VQISLDRIYGYAVYTVTSIFIISDLCQASELLPALVCRRVRAYCCHGGDGDRNQVTKFAHNAWFTMDSAIYICA
jgi:hypothetical protein